MARAKAEARLTFAKKEMALKVEKAHLEATMDMLSLEQETAAAVAEAEVLEAAADCSDRSSFKSHLDLQDAAPLDPTARTIEYVVEQAKEQSKMQFAPPLHLPSQDEIRQSHTEPALALPIQIPHMKDEHSQVDIKPFSTRPNQMLKAQQPQHTPKEDFYTTNKQDYHRSNEPKFTNHSPPFSTMPSHASPYSHHDQPIMTDLVRYFARRELVTTGLTQFNDQPQSYRAWKRSFKNALSGLDLSASEETDLLVKWLGKDSAEHAKRIRAVHVNLPGRGLSVIWERLDACYGAPEVIEDALFQRIDSFPKISNREYGKLHELSDLLMELEAAKADGDLPGLYYLDTARGINPLVQKLPFSLQEKWLSLGSSYKLRHNIPFPPFEVFVDFIKEQATIRNDPSFRFTTQADVVPKADKTPWRSTRQKEISVHKTDVCNKAHLATDKHEIRTDNSERLCPIHKRPHLLQKCRAFREKPLEERKAFLKENRICYKCCTSTQHTAKYCESQTICHECGSVAVDQKAMPRCGARRGERLSPSFRSHNSMHSSLWSKSE